MVVRYFLLTKRAAEDLTETVFNHNFNNTKKPS